MSTVEDLPIVLDRQAGDLAFQAGQFVAKLLRDRGIERTRSSESSIVRADDIRACIDDSLLEELKNHLNERRGQDSRNAA